MKTTNIENPYIGAVCRKGNKIIMESTPSGYCLSTWDEDGPCCRISGYADTEEGAKLLIPDRVCEENIFCNGGCGCGIQVVKEDSSDSKDSSEEHAYVYYVIEEISAKLVAIPKTVIVEDRNRHGGLSRYDDSDIASVIVHNAWEKEKVVLDADDHQEVNYIELVPGDEENHYNYLLEHYKDTAVVIDSL